MTWDDLTPAEKREAVDAFIAVSLPAEPVFAPIGARVTEANGDEDYHAGIALTAAQAEQWRTGVVVEHRDRCRPQVQVAWDDGASEWLPADHVVRYQVDHNDTRSDHR